MNLRFDVIKNKLDQSIRNQGLGGNANINTSIDFSKKQVWFSMQVCGGRICKINKQQTEANTAHPKLPSERNDDIKK